MIKFFKEQQSTQKRKENYKLNNQKKGGRMTALIVFLALFLCVALIGTNIFTVEAFAKTTGTVNVDDTLNVRSGPGADYSVIGYVTDNTNVEILGEEDGWYEISYGGGTGYVSKLYVTGIVNDGEENTVSNEGDYVTDISYYGTYYNLFSVNQTDSNPKAGGISYAMSHDWTSLPASIIGGAKFCAEGYLDNGQDTYYYMHFNVPNQVWWHQYSTGILAGRSCARILAYAYDDYSPEYMLFKIPVYQEEGQGGNTGQLLSRTDASASFEDQLKAFPESWKEKIETLHALYPNAVFVAEKYDITIKKVAENEIGLKKTIDGTFATEEDIEELEKYINPYTYLNSTDVFMFLDHHKTSTQCAQGLSNIFAIYPSTFLNSTENINALLTASENTGLSAYVMASTIILEKGWDAHTWNPDVYGRVVRKGYVNATGLTVRDWPLTGDVMGSLTNCEVYIIGEANDTNGELWYEVIFNGLDGYIKAGESEEKEQVIENPSKDETVPDLAAGVYSIRTALASDKVLDIELGSTESGANLQIYESNGTGAQQFSISYDSDGLATITNVNSGKALDVQWGNAYDCANVWQYDSNNSKAQKWIISKNSDGSYKIASAINSNYVLDIQWGSTSNGTNVQIYTSNGSNAQKFYFDLAGGNSGSSGGSTTQPVSDGLADGTYTIKSASDTSKVLDISGASIESGANLQIYTSNGTNAQKFKITSDGNGFVTISAVCSGKPLDVQWGNACNGANVWQYDGNGTSAQKWKLEKNSDGTYTIKSALNQAYVLDIQWGSTANGTNVQVYESNGTNAQKWVIE